MIDRSVVSKRHPQAARQTRDDITTLKLKVVSSERAQRPLGHRLSTIIKDLIHYCSFRAGSTKNQCRIYGHIIKPKGDVFFCKDCGTKVTDPQQLRTASATSNRGDMGDGSWK